MSLVLQPTCTTCTFRIRVERKKLINSCHLRKEMAKMKWADYVVEVLTVCYDLRSVLASFQNDRYDGNYGFVNPKNETVDHDQTESDKDSNNHTHNTSSTLIWLIFFIHLPLFYVNYVLINDCT